MLEAVQQDGEEMLGKLQTRLPPFTAEKQAMTIPPLLVELCLQTAGVWEIGKTGTLALPRSIANLKVYPETVNGSAIYAEVKPHESQDGGLSFDARVVDADGHIYIEMEDYRTAPLPYSLEKEQLRPLRTWMAKSQG